MIDVHSHILPGVDDGARDLKMTFNMLQNSLNEFTKEIIATPHFLSGYVETPYIEIKKRVKELNAQIAINKLDIKVYYGQEIYYTHKILEYFNKGLIGTINDSRYMLIELPRRDINRRILDSIYELRILGIIPIIAHPERCSKMIEYPEYINEFINEGCLFQLNAGSLNGYFGKKTKRTAEKLLSYGVYNFIGSDAHDDKRRTTGIREAAKLSKLFMKNSCYIFNESSENLILDKEIEFIGNKIKKKRKIFNFLDKDE